MRSSIHPSTSQIPSSSLFYLVLLQWRKLSFVNRATKIGLISALLPEKQPRLGSLQLLSHVRCSYFFSCSSSSSPDFQRPEDNGTPHDAIVLSLSHFLSFVGGDLKFCFKTPTVPILLNPPPLHSSGSSCLSPFLLSILPNPSELQSELLKTRGTLGSQPHHWERHRDRQRLSCLLFYRSDNKKSFCSSPCYSGEIELGITHNTPQTLTHTYTHLKLKPGKTKWRLRCRTWRLFSLRLLQTNKSKKAWRETRKRNKFSL